MAEGCAVQKWISPTACIIDENISSECGAQNSSEYDESVNY